MCVSWFAHTDEHVPCFHCLIVVDDASVGVQGSQCLLPFLRGIYLEVKLVHHLVTLCQRFLSFKKYHFYVYILPTCMYMYHNMCLMFMEVRRRIGYPELGVINGCGPIM